MIPFSASRCWENGKGRRGVGSTRTSSHPPFWRRGLLSGRTAVSAWSVITRRTIVLWPKKRGVPYRALLHRRHTAIESKCGRGFKGVPGGRHPVLPSVSRGTKGIAPSPIAGSAMSVSVAVWITRSYTVEWAWLGRVSVGIQGRERLSRAGKLDKPSHPRLSRVVSDSCSCWFY